LDGFAETGQLQATGMMILPSLADGIRTAEERNFGLRLCKYLENTDDYAPYSFHTGD